METNAKTFRDRFWDAMPPLPPGLSIVHEESLVVPQTGRGGAAVYDLATLSFADQRVPLLVAARSPVLATDVPRLSQRMQSIANERRQRAFARQQAFVPQVPVLATEVAQPSVVAACQRAGMGVIDQQGTLVLQAGGAFLHVVGTAKVTRLFRTSLFGGKASRIVRLLLSAPAVSRTARVLSTLSETSYVYTHGLLTRFEQLGFVSRKSPRAGYVVADAGGLLRAWLDAGERTPLTVDAWNAPSTTPEALAKADAARRQAGVAGIFTLASALRPDEVHVGGLPHGMYLAGDAAPVVAALGLRRKGPANFLLLRASPLVETSAGGLFHGSRSLPQGEGVALPQLIIDLAQAGGRGPEQAEFLFDRWLAAQPLRAEAP